MAVFENISNPITSVLNAEKLSLLNQMIAIWRGLFEEPPAKELWFSVNDQNYLCLEDVQICHMEDIDANGACCDFEAFYFDSIYGGYYPILITWDFDENIYVREVAHILYDGPENDVQE